MRLLVALACLLASASSQTTTNLPGVGERLHGKKPAGTGTSLRAKQLRAVLSWHCGRSATSQYHIEDKPCQNFRFMQKLRAATASKDLATRKKLMQERSATLPKDAAGKKELVRQQREGYTKIYKAYCQQPSPKVPEVCSSSLVK